MKKVKLFINKILNYIEAKLMISIQSLREKSELEEKKLRERKELKKVEENNGKQEEDGFKGFLIDFFEAFLIFIFISTFFYQGFLIPSGSMKPQLIEGDCIMVSKFAYGYSRYSFPFGLPLFKGRILDFKKPKRGDVIVFRLPTNPRINYIKRLIGLPNDVVQVKNRILYINGQKIERQYISDYVDKTDNLKVYGMFEEQITDKKKIKVLQDMQRFIISANDTDEYRIPEGYYFFMGDNRDNSLDSRFIETGFVPYENIVGKAQIVFFSRRDSLLKFWTWFSSIKLNRIFKIIR